MPNEARHPGAGRRRARSTPKGRQADPALRQSVRALLGPEPLRRDLLIEYLHTINDTHGRLPPDHLAALAAEMRLPQAEIFETASFYAHFAITDAPTPTHTIRICDGLPCQMAGADALADSLAARLPARILRVPCIGNCANAPAAQYGHEDIAPATAETLRAATQSPPHPTIAPPTPHPYTTLQALREGRLTASTILDTLDTAGLAGMGGAGFPTARKWRTVRAQPGPRLMAVNADEGEPGTFKDRFCLETNPHRVLEGALIAAEVVGADTIYFYIRDEYPTARALFAQAIAARPQGGPAIELRRGAGAYICGEESAMLESIEGKRGLPRHKPPFVFQHGLFGRPTLINNVETLYWVPEILARGAPWWRSLGRNDQTGQRLFSVSGRVANPGVKCAPNGVTAHDLIHTYAGGMAPGHNLAAFLPGGASGGILPAHMAHTPLGFGTLQQYGCFVGSAALIVLSQHDNLKAAARNLMEFFRDESCGQCTPCRAGTEKAATLMQSENWNTQLLTDLATTMQDASICGLGQAAPNPVLSLFRFFPELFA